MYFVLNFLLKTHLFTTEPHTTNMASPFSMFQREFTQDYANAILSKLYSL